MKRSISSRSLGKWAARLWALLPILMVVLSLMGPVPRASAADLWTDEFSAATLDARWSWVREDANFWNLTKRPGFLQIKTQPGGVSGALNEQKNILVTEAPGGDFILTARLQIDPTANNQYAGVALYVDDDNYLLIRRAFADQDLVSFDQEIGGVVTSKTFIIDNVNVYLRIIKDGDTYYGAVSLGRDIWYLVGYYKNVPLASPKIALMAANGLDTLTDSIPADFDYVQVESNEQREYGFVQTETFDQTSLVKPWALIYPDLTHFTLTDRPGWLRITTQVPPNSAKHANLLLQSRPPYGSFQIATKVDFQPTTAVQTAGLLLYQDDSNYLELVRGYCDTENCIGDGIYFNYIFGCGIDMENFATPVTQSGPIYLRLVVEDNIYAAYYSFDGTIWTLVGRKSGTNSFQPGKIGLRAANAMVGDVLPPEISADFDFFTLSRNYAYFIPMVSR